MLLSYVLDGTTHGHGMDELAELHLCHKTIHYADVAGKGAKTFMFADVAIVAGVALLLYDSLFGSGRNAEASEAGNAN